MKKTLALTMAAVVLLLSACGGAAPAEKTGEPAPEITAAPTREPTQAPTATPEATPTPAEEAAAREAAEEEAPPEPSAKEAPEGKEEPAPEEKEQSAEEELWDSSQVLSLGSVDGNTYTNEALGIGCTVAEGWTFQTEDFIRVLNNWGENALGDDWQELIRNSDVFTDMMAMAPNGTDNVNVQIQNMNRLYGMLLSEDVVVDATVKTMSDSGMLQDAGYEDPEISKITLTFLGEEHSGIRITGTAFGHSVFQKEVLLSCGDYMAIIAATSFDEDITDDILAGFFRL